MQFKTRLALAMASVLSFGTAAATTLQKLSLAEITQRATVAVVGEVASARSAHMPDGPYTLMTIDVQQSWWGTHAATLTVAVPGGSHANAKVRVGTVIAGAAMPLKGQRAVFMLAPDAVHGGYAIVGFHQGLIPLLRTSRGDAVMLPGAGRATMLPEAERLLRQTQAGVRSTR